MFYLLTILQRKRLIKILKCHDSSSSVVVTTAPGYTPPQYGYQTVYPQQQPGYPQQQYQAYVPPYQAYNPPTVSPYGGTN